METLGVVVHRLLAENAAFSERRSDRVVAMSALDALLRYLHLMQTATGNRMRELREAKDLEQYDIAAIVRKSSSMVSRYEKGESDVPSDVMRVLAAFHGVSVEYLMGWDRQEQPA